LQNNEKTIESVGISARRIETLVDGVFAIAMTLLVLGIAVPSITNPTEASLYQALLDLLPNFYSYFISFVLLAVFWRINHVQFNRIKRADDTLLWIIVIWLLFVALVPFSAFFVGEYGNFQIPKHLLRPEPFCHRIFIIPKRASCIQPWIGGWCR